MFHSAVFSQTDSPIHCNSLDIAAAMSVIQEDLLEIFKKAIAAGHEITPVPDDNFENMCQKLKDQNVGRRLHMFKDQLEASNGQVSKIFYNTELGFNHTVLGKLHVIMPMSFVDAMLEKLGDKVEDLPGLIKYFQEFPNEDEFDAMVDLNHTGNHKRNKVIRIPVQPGQPVRG